jgi:hypothetical protein
MDGITAAIAAVVTTAYTVGKIVKSIKDGCPPSQPTIALPTPAEVERYGRSERYFGYVVGVAMLVTALIGALFSN